MDRGKNSKIDVKGRRSREKVKRKKINKKGKVYGVVFGPLGRLLAGTAKGCVLALYGCQSVCVPEKRPRRERVL